jgi:Flp pilus assembly protein CpaB
VMNLILKDSQDSTTASQDGTGTSQGGTVSQGQGTTGFGFFDLSDTAKKAGDIMGDKEYVVFPQTSILLWNVQVLSIGVNVASTTQSNDAEAAAADKNNAKETFKTVTLAVTPEQAEKLIFAQELGSVWFALMPSKGINEQETPGRTYFNITD